MPGLRNLLIAVVALTLALGAVPQVVFSSAVRAQGSTPVSGQFETGPVLLMAADGLDDDLIQQFAAEGAMPNYAALEANGARGSTGLQGPFPGTRGTGLWTLITGTWPAEHGIVGDRFYRTGSPEFTDFTEWTDAGILQADTLPQAVERAGKTVVSVGWEGLSTLDPQLAGPVVGPPIEFSRSGIVTNRDHAGQPEAADQHGVAYERIELRPADDWTGAPESFSPALETNFTIESLEPDGVNPDRSIDVLIYDATDDGSVNYDRIAVAPDNADSPLTDIVPGAWQAVPVELSGEREGETAGFWLKALELSPSADDFRLYFSPISRLPATWEACGDQEVCTAPGGFEEAVNSVIGPPLREDTAALSAGLIDNPTFVEQGTTGAWQSIDALRYIVDTLGGSPDLLLLGTSFPAHVAEHIPVAAPDSGSESDASNVSLLRDSYQMADHLLGAGQEALGHEASVFVASTRDLASSTRGVDAGQVLMSAGLADNPQPASCVPGPVDTPPGTPDPEAPLVGPAVKACWDGETAGVYINLQDREPAGVVPAEEYESVRDAIVAAFEGLADPAQPDASVVASVLRQEELRDVSGADALHPSRAPDVVVVLSPPYRFVDGGDAAVVEAPPRGIGTSGVASETDGSPAGLLLVAGPEIAPGASAPARAIDVAPTAAMLLGVPGPFNASGALLFGFLRDGPVLNELTLLDISDFHGQLTPLIAPADNIESEGAINGSFDVGGVAYLAYWFDRYRAEAQGPTLLVTAGDAVGATPPISSFFGDVPTIEAMNQLGFAADSLGNHNFDAGATYMFETLAAAASFPYLSANLVPAPADETLPDAPFEPSLVVDEAGMSIGLIGFSNPDIPQLTRPGALDPYRVINPVEVVNMEAARLRDDGVEVVIAIGHMGATGGTVTDPTGPLIDVVDQLRGIDVVVGDHTDFEVSALLPNSILVVENRSKGVMFTRVRVVVDDNTGEVIYRTADHHRPWTAGVTPDAELVASLEARETELAPILGEVIGSATMPIPRADSCGTENGRTCETLIGNVITDAMRLTYNTDFAITNSGGIRASLTCPEDLTDFCPADAGPNAITRGQVLTVLPFGNVVVTVPITGAELKRYLENGVSRMPEVVGAFPQVSGLCFTYDIDAPPGNRVSAAVRQNADGTCGTEAIDFSDNATYTLATNDFLISGGDGYPRLQAEGNTRDILADVVAEAIAGDSVLSLPGAALEPRLDGRIVCTGSACPTPVAEQADPS